MARKWIVAIVTACVLSCCGKEESPMPGTNENRPMGVLTCDGVDCSGLGECVERGKGAVCRCEEGYRSVELRCIADSEDPCEGVTCSGHGSCEERGRNVRCRCGEGYRAEGLTCVARSGD